MRQVIVTAIVSSENDYLKMLLLETSAHQKDLGTILHFQDISEDSFESLYRG